MQANSKDTYGLLIIFFSSFLLGIWATTNTIALRNILLVITTLISLVYLKRLFKDGQLSFSKTRIFSLGLLDWAPLGLILSMFIWLIVHYLFFSQFPEKQWNELTSSWLRAFLAAIIGFSCAIALRRNQSFAWLLWLGLIVSFLVLLYQYIPKAIAKNSLFAPDYFGNYIYWAKFNGVLAGIILFAGTLGLSIDSLRQLQTDPCAKVNESHRLNKAIMLIFIALGLLLPIYSFVFIFNAKNGVGVAAILLIFWFIIVFIYLWSQFFKNEGLKQSGRKWARWIAAYLIILMIFSWFAYHHTKNNSGWESLIEDILVSVQTDAYQNWKNPSKYGYPLRKDGLTVAANAYERAAWGAVGFKLIVKNPLGNGVLRSLPQQMKQNNIEFNYAAYTHSAWIDLGLSYGWPGILLIPTALLICLIACIKKYRGPYRATVASLVVSFLVMYLVGEYALQHGIEILLFVCTLLAGLILPNQKPIPARYSVQ